MPSMTYCMFENTETEMLQLLNAMSEAQTLDELDLNENEMASFHELYYKCQKYRRDWERLTSEEGE